MILITGGTGFLGTALSQRLLQRDPQTRLLLLVRPSGRESAENRARQVLSTAFPETRAANWSSRIEIVSGELTEKNFGLGDGEFRQLASRVNTIFHCAASTALNQSLADARHTNVTGTKRVIEFAEAGVSAGRNPVRLHHISTAYVAGDTENTVGPTALGSSFRNYYEQSKAEAEILLRGIDARIIPTIYRPSVIVGDSVTGHTSAFNVLYIPARFLAKGLLKALPAKPNAPFDIVPIDFVADAICALYQLPDAEGKSFHLCAGVGRESSPLEILNFIISTFQIYRRRMFYTPHLIPPEMAALAHSSLVAACAGIKSVEKSIEKIFLRRFAIFSQALPFIPYMLRNPRFDTSGTTQALSGILPEAPLFNLYAEKIFGYCIDSNWGKLPRPIPTPVGN